MLLKLYYSTVLTFVLGKDQRISTLALQFIALYTQPPQPKLSITYSWYLIIVADCILAIKTMSPTH